MLLPEFLFFFFKSSSCINPTEHWPPWAVAVSLMPVSSASPGDLGHKGLYLLHLQISMPRSRTEQTLTDEREGE